MEKSNSIRALAESRLAYETAEFKKDFESGDMARIPERYFPACRGEFMFWVWGRYLYYRNQNSASGNDSTIQEFVSLLESRGHSVTHGKVVYEILVGKTRFHLYLKESHRGKNHYIIEAITPESDVRGRIIFVRIRLVNVESLIEGMEQLDAVNDEFIARLDSEIEHWKKMLRINSETL